LFGALIVPAVVIAETAVTTPATNPAATQPATTNAAPVATTRIKRGSLPMKFDATGYFEAVDPTEVRLRFKQYIGELTINAVVPNGSTVAKGDKLLEIDPVPLKKLLDAAENDLAAAKAALEKNEADFKLSESIEAFNLKTHQDALKDAEDALKWWESVDGPQMLKAWDLQMKQYQHLVDDRADELEQLKKMYKTEELTSATADIVVKRAVRGLEQAKVGLEMEKERIDKNKTIAYPASKRAVTDALTKARHALASHQILQTNVQAQWRSALFTSRTAMATAAQKVSELRGDLDKLTVIAPSDGIVWYGQLNNGNWFGGDAKSMRVGEKLTAGAILLTLHAPGKLRVVVDLPEPKYFSVSAGTKAIATPTAFPDLRIEGLCEAPPRTGVLTQDRGVVFPLKITGQDVDARLIPGMKASVHLEVSPLANLLLVPAGAVSNGEVWVREKGQEKKRAVITGHSDGKSIEVVSGLTEGEEVLTQAKAAN
jgi:multidrug resistance efflux pump